MRDCHSERSEESNNFQLSIINCQLNSPLPIATLPHLLSSRTREPMLLRGIFSLSLSLSQKLCQFPSF